MARRVRAGRAATRPMGDGCPSRRTLDRIAHSSVRAGELRCHRRSRSSSGRFDGPRPADSRVSQRSAAQSPARKRAHAAVEPRGRLPAMPGLSAGGADGAADGLLGPVPPGTDPPAAAGRARSSGPRDPGALRDGAAGETVLMTSVSRARKPPSRRAPEQAASYLVHAPFLGQPSRQLGEAERRQQRDRRGDDH